jgi:hypothetical protein
MSLFAKSIDPVHMAGPGGSEAQPDPESTPVACAICDRVTNHSHELHRSPDAGGGGIWHLAWIVSSPAVPWRVTSPTCLFAHGEPVYPYMLAASASLTVHVFVRLILQV